MSDLSTVNAEGCKALLGEKGNGIEVAWIEALVAAGVELSFHPFDPADIAKAINPNIKSLFLLSPPHRGITARGTTLPQSTGLHNATS